MHDRFGYFGLFAAYNAGPSRYADHLASGRALPGETRAYLAAVNRALQSVRNASAEVAADRLFFVVRTSAPAPGNGSTGLFVALGGNTGDRE